MAVNPQFRCWVDDTGDIWVAPGTVICPADRSVHQLAPGTLPAASLTASPRRPASRPFATPQGDTLVGGSGNNTTTAPTIANTLVAAGLFRPTASATWTAHLLGNWTITLNLDGSADISDGTDIVASVAAASCTLAPYGTFAATTYGKDTYNSGNPFDIEVTYEGGGTIPAAAVTATSGTMQTGTYSADSFQAFTSDDDGDWSLAIADDGSAEIADATDIVATRLAGYAGPTDPRGIYIPTDYGRNTYNAGDDFSVVVYRAGGDPILGTVYITITETAPGIVGSVSGPFFAVSLPADSPPDYHVPIAEVTADGPVQILDGPVWWGPVVAPTFAVADLPSAATAGSGSRAFVSDSNTTLAAGLGATVAGGGAYFVPVFSDGTNWIIG